LTGAVTGVHVEHPGLLLLAVVTVAAALSPIPAYAHQTGRIHYRESSLALLWALAFAVLLPLSVRSLAMFNLPLQDSHFRISRSRLRSFGTQGCSMGRKG